MLAFYVYYVPPIQYTVVCLHVYTYCFAGENKQTEFNQWSFKRRVFSSCAFISLPSAVFGAFAHSRTSRRPQSRYLLIPKTRSINYYERNEPLPPSSQPPRVPRGKRRALRHSFVTRFLICIFAPFWYYYCYFFSYTSGILTLLIVCVLKKKILYSK